MFYLTKGSYRVFLESNCTKYRVYSDEDIERKHEMCVRKHVNLKPIFIWYNTHNYIDSNDNGYVNWRNPAFQTVVLQCTA